MTQNKKILLGVLTFLPILFFIWYFYTIFSFIGGLSEFGPGDMNENEIFSSMMLKMFLPIGLMMLTSLGLLVYYIVDIFSLNPNFKTENSNNKIAWTLVVLFAGFIGMYVYFFIEIVPRKVSTENQQLL